MTKLEKKLKISILIPAHNEEESIADCVNSCFMQTRKLDEIIVVNDGSTDKTGEILAGFGDKIRVVTILKPTGNKSLAQEHGLKFVTGDVFVSTDGDTMLDPNFIKYIEDDFMDPKITAVAGYVRSLKYNWLTACRAVEYSIGQNLHKLAQHYINFLFVIPGAAGAFRTKDFFKYISFEHDTLTEDLDFTYRLHRLGLRIFFDHRAVVFTQDPASLHSYINQIRRWFGGGWQCLVKHRGLVFKEPRIAFEVSLIYMENFLFSCMLFIAPLLSLRFFGMFIIMFLIVGLICSAFASWTEKRWSLLLVPIPYLFLIYVNSYVFLEQMVSSVILGHKKLVWFHPKRVSIKR
jgi:cellulose synthase/poly-beta-1,6-N-acetylglucosamine synthase-like glycosyltransferase